MSNDDVREAFNICVSGGENPDCDTCPYKDIYDYRECFIVLRRHALELINRQKAEIERLQKNLSNLAASMEKCECSKIARVEAIKEFAKKIEDTIWYSINSKGELVIGANSEFDVALYKADDILKIAEEMVGDNK